MTVRDLSTDEGVLEALKDEVYRCEHELEHAERIRTDAAYRLAVAKGRVDQWKARLQL
jgi:hypothetical protein